MSRDPIYVTRPFLPPLSQLVPLLEEIWERRWLTNNGPCHERLQERLAGLFAVPHVSLMANGMLALEAAIDAAELTGEIVTTPYSFVATTHAIRRAQVTPVFADVLAGDLNIDPAAVERAITPRTSAIVAVHCYGNPCDTQALQAIADAHRLTLIYDAAHAFGVTRDGRSILGEGDYSTISFHATKAFNTFEGGAVVTRSEANRRAIDFQRNFGIADEVSVPHVGSNAKMSEFNAALGLLQLDHFEESRRARAAVDRRYRERLEGVAGITCLPIPEGVEPNFSYFPILVGPGYGLSRDRLYERLKADGIYARRYFFPLLSNLPMYRELPSADPANLPVANRAAEQILCLPIYPDLPEEDQERVIAIVRDGAA